MVFNLQSLEQFDQRVISGIQPTETTFVVFLSGYMHVKMGKAGATMV